MSDNKQISALNVRVWIVEGGVHPAHEPQFLALGKFSDDPTHPFGDETRVTAPDRNNFNRDITVGTIKGTEERATFSIASRYTTDKSLLLRWARRQCQLDVYALIGKCGNPQDFTEGGEKFVYFPDGRINEHSFENFGAYGQDENNPTNEMIPMTSEDYYEFLYMRQAQIAAAESVRELYTVDVYRGDNCDDCPDPCGTVLFTMAGTGATPGTQPLLLYSEDGGSTFDTDTIDTLFSTEDVADGEVIGSYLVLISHAGNEIHYIKITELLDGTGVWAQTDTGFVVGHEPTEMTAADIRHVWIVGDGGYVYFASDFKVKVTVQDAGVATTQGLNSVNAYDKEHVLAVGNSNAVIYTWNGGDTWESVTGPAVGVNLGACWMWDENTWFVGEGAGGTGKLWYTENAGQTWTEKGLPSTYSRIYKIKFLSKAEGYLSAVAGGKCVILRTKTGGYEWNAVPEGDTGVALDNSYLSDIAVCEPNTAFAAGLADNGTAGIGLKMTA